MELTDVPEEIKDRLARTVAAFMKAHKLQHDEVTEFVMDITTIMSDYFDWEKGTTPKEK